MSPCINDEINYVYILENEEILNLNYLKNNLIASSFNNFLVNQSTYKSK